MSYVLDASALFAYFEEQHNYQLVSDLFSKASSSHRLISMTTINWGEVYYLALQRRGQTAANLVSITTGKLPIELIAADKELTQLAGQLKIDFGLAYVDSFAAALTKSNKATLITADQDFRAIQKEIDILWI